MLASVVGPSDELVGAGELTIAVVESADAGGLASTAGSQTAFRGERCLPSRLLTERNPSTCSQLARSFCTRPASPPRSSRSMVCSACPSFLIAAARMPAMALSVFSGVGAEADRLL